ncbi:MAG: 8-amino-7-oxononanoate synthase [Isosphaeraceae bacterium]|nr:8-amino-7-oxononanoate synthase [Isosphaeraceae bacterium]
MNPDPLAWIDREAADWAARGLRRSPRPTERTPRATAIRDGRELIDFGSNDYLGLAHDPRVIEAAAAAADRYGAGAGASPLVTGWSPVHAELVERLAEFEGVEAVALFPSGFAANLGTLSALVGRGDAVYLDRLDHACLVDGARLAGATLRVYPHREVDRLEATLAREAGRFRRIAVVTDGVFSMDGDLAPLDRLVDVAERFGAMLIVDEAHGTGVHGPLGRGACEAFGVVDRVAVRVGTLSKALGSIGGFVAGSRRLVDHLVERAHPLVFSTALPPASAAAALASLAIVEAEPELRERSRALGRAIAIRLAKVDIALEGVDGPIVPIVVGGATTATSLAARLEDRGLLVPAIRPPTVPQGTARLRISVSARHSDAQLERLLAALAAELPGAIGADADDPRRA